MKKLIALLLVLVIGIGLVACGAAQTPAGDDAPADPCKHRDFRHNRCGTVYDSAASHLQSAQPDLLLVSCQAPGRALLLHFLHGGFHHSGDHLYYQHSGFLLGQYLHLHFCCSDPLYPFAGTADLQETAAHLPQCTAVCEKRLVCICRHQRPVLCGHVLFCELPDFDHQPPGVSACIRALPCAFAGHLSPYSQHTAQSAEPA